MSEKAARLAVNVLLYQRQGCQQHSCVVLPGVEHPTQSAMYYAVHASDVLAVVSAPTALCGET